MSPWKVAPLRVAVLAYDTVAASNAPGAEQIHSMLDRSRASALWRPGSSLLAARFSAVPLLAQAWGIGRIGLPFGDHGRLAVMGFELPVPVDTELIASLRYSGSVHLRMEEIAPDTLAAQHTAEAVDNILGVLRGLASAEGPANPRDAAMRAILSSAKVTQQNDRAILTANASVEQAHLLSTAEGRAAGEQHADGMARWHPQRSSNHKVSRCTARSPVLFSAQTERLRNASNAVVLRRLGDHRCQNRFDLSSPSMLARLSPMRAWNSAASRSSLHNNRFPRDRAPSPTTPGNIQAYLLIWVPPICLSP